MPVYIELFHGRHHPDEELDDWGFQGPVLGPFPFCHITYGSHIKVGDDPRSDLETFPDEGSPMFDDELSINKDGMVELFGSFYGDFSIFDRKTLNSSPDLKDRWEETKKVLKSKKEDLPLMIHEDTDWIKTYVELRLKTMEAKHGTNTGKSPTSRGSKSSKPSTGRRRKNP